MSLFEIKRMKMKVNTQNRKMFLNNPSLKILSSEAVILTQLTDGPGSDVVHEDRVALGDEVGGHTPAHVAQT